MYVRIAPMLLAAWLAGPAAALAQEGPGSTETCEPPEPVRIGRVWGRHHVEERRLVLTTCDGSPNRAALDALSVLARPRDAEVPDEERLAAFRAAHPRGRLVAPGIARLHPGLLTRLQAIADRFPGRRIEIISGYRPHARRTSRHHHARALDIRVQGVSRAHVSQHARTLDETGVGYYPNSLFTHVDVRERSAYWVDRSGPGQPADYGPPRRPAPEVDRERREIVAKALTSLGEETGATSGERPDEPATADMPAEPERPDEPATPDMPAEPERPDEPTPAAAPDGEAAADDGIDWTPPDPWNAPPCEDEGPPLTPGEIAALRQRWLDAVRALGE